MQWIEKCLNTCRGYNVIVIDNNSTDKTVSFIEEKYKGITVIQQSENLGFGQANNIGISYALKQGAEAICLLNQDAYLVNDALEQLITFKNNNTEYGVLSPIHVTRGLKKLDKNFANYISYNKNSNFISDYVLNKPIKSVYQVPFVNAAAWLISKACIEKVGGFDPIFFHYGEDDNYCQRVVYHGFKIGILPNTYIVHDREGLSLVEIKQFSNQYLKMIENKYKVRFANINDSEAINNLKDEYKKINKAIIKFLLRIDFKKSTGFFKKRKLLNRIKPEIIESYTINKTLGMHYIK
jgi:GT2 family glycosyltransferase